MIGFVRQTKLRANKHKHTEKMQESTLGSPIDMCVKLMMLVVTVHSIKQLLNFFADGFLGKLPLRLNSERTSRPI